MHNLDIFFLLCDFLIVFMQHRTYEDIGKLRVPRHWSYHGLLPVLVHTLGLWIGNILTFMNCHRVIAQISYGIAYAASYPLARKVGGSRAWVSSGYICISIIAIIQGLLNYDPIYIFRLTQSHILTRSSIRLYRFLGSKFGFWTEHTAYSMGQLTGGLFGCYYSFENITVPLLWWVSSCIMSVSVPIRWIVSTRQYPYNDNVSN
jgi:hypothetical protein